MSADYHPTIASGQAFRLFHTMGWPDLGGIDAWEWWVVRTWEGLNDIGWFEDLAERGTFAYEQQQRLTVFALRWLAEDLCEQMVGGNEPYWDEWIDRLELDTSYVISVAGRHTGWAQVVQDAKEECYEEAHLDIMSELETEEERDDEIEHFEGEVAAMLGPQAVCLVAAQMRPVLVRALDRVWGGRHRLFQSWWAVLHSSEVMYPNHEDDHDDDPADEAGHAGDGAVDDPSTPTPSLASQLNRAAADAFDDVFSVDAETSQRLIVFEWVTGGCGVEVRGEPAYLD